MEVLALIATASATFLVNGGLITWVYKVMNDQMKAQKSNFEHQITQLRAEIDGLRQSENRFIQKYKFIYNHFRTFKCANNNDGGKCNAFDAYMDKLEQEGGIL